MSDNNSEYYSVFADVAKAPVNWLWYPYIPCGKLVILQGDPGEGKSTLIMDIIAKLTTGRPLPDGRTLPPMNVIYQCSEDGLADTIKPRLEKAHADCNRVGYIKEDLFGLSLDDEKIRSTIVRFDARLLVIDPFQAYIGDADMSSATGMRKILRRLCMWASAFNCSIILVGHLNKRSGSNELYRGLGSIDLVAAARSVIQIDRSSESPAIRIVRHIKSSLAPKANDIPFSIDYHGCVSWTIPASYLYSGLPSKETNYRFVKPTHQTKQEKAVDLLTELLRPGPREAQEIEKELLERGIGARTIKIAKGIINVISRKKENKWYWYLPGTGESELVEEIPKTTIQ